MSNPVTDALKHQGSGANVRHPIGVPDDYSVKVPNERYTAPGTPHSSMGGHQITGKVPQQRGQGARYYAGDQYKPAGMSIEDQAQLQMALIQAGLLDPADYQAGVWDDNTSKAYADLLAESNQSGQRWQQQLGYRLDLAAQGLIARKGASKKPPLTITHTSPTDIKAVVADRSAALLGRTLQPGEQDLFVKGYNDQETAAQTSAYNQQYNADGTGYGAGGTTTSAPDLGAYADESIKTKYKSEVTGNQLGQNALEFLKVLTSGAQGGSGIPGHTT